MYTPDTARIQGKGERDHPVHYPVHDMSQMSTTSAPRNVIEGPWWFSKLP